MANTDWENLKKALQKPPTDEARKEAADAFRRCELAKLTKSTPTLVSLGFRKNYPRSIKVSEIPDEIERNPEFFDFLSKVVS